ncbi:MAG: DUF4861 domain-containing protein [Bacteroidetes bacterium]|nr:MAG: DUF4861 domain-containing protein [Bacteroidota bacterium]
MSRLSLFVLIAAMVAACTPSAPRLVVQSDIARPGAVLVYSRAELAAAGLAVSAPQASVYLQGPDGAFLPSQLDDLDGDGAWDELAFQVDLPVGELALSVVTEAPASVTFPVKTDIHLGVSAERNHIYEEVAQADRAPENTPQVKPPFYQMEGPAWENDVIAFRSYFDRRNGKDIFGKLVPDLVADTLGIRGNYHAMDPSWGMDVLKVGNSLGAGALALMVNDSLIRLGETRTHSFRKLVEGPVRSIMELMYAGWQVGDQTLAVQERIEIRAGEPGYHNTVTLSGFSGTAELVSGIVNLHSEEVYSIDPEGGWSGIATHAQQSENNDYLGMALLTPRLAATGMAPEEAPEAPEGMDPAVTQTYWASTRVAPGEVAQFYFLAAWEASDAKWADQTAFLNLAAAEAVWLGHRPSLRME